MKIKFNWGTGIFIVIALFLLGVVAFFIYMSNLDINLVEDNYYEKELVYQHKIDKLRNTEALPSKIRINTDKEAITIQFPEPVGDSSTRGHIIFYRPSDPSLDFTMELQPDDSIKQIIPTSGMAPGKWTVKIDWTTAGTDYYFEEGIFIQKP
jgi:nitrogen fixation protein FixH